MFLTALLLALSTAFFWAGFKAPRHPLQHQSQAGFVVTLSLAGLTGYFDWRESQMLADLAEHIDPVPGITDVSYVPTAAEVAALSQVLAAAPSTGRLGDTQEERHQLAVEAREQHTDYWLVKTALLSDSVLAFYRERGPRLGWTVETDTPPWLIMSRESGRLVLFVSDESPRPGSKVMYSFSPRPR